jgi:hypothetical protein
MQFLRSIFFFYYDGLRNMTVFGKSLWKLIILKAVILVIIAYFLFPDTLKKDFKTDEERANHVGSNIMNINTNTK